ncbi:MAG: glutathione S-transferase N-terminal domain-containing protein [Gammaproteobacteria bacterium]|nr:glutathione S-transferase N-terminal domain-containing protein [Gammaproteobacteria bacterium]
MITAVNLFTSTLASSLRGWQGIRSRTDSRKPAELLKLYDIENCPFCRIAREVLTELDLDAIILPCPKGGTRFRTELLERGGKELFPYLVDENTGAEMYESMDIVAYLFETYGGGSVPLRWKLGPLQKLSSGLASAARMSEGMFSKASTLPKDMLELYSFEASPFARPVRELLCDLEIPYILRSCGRSEAGEWLPPKLRERLNIAPESELPNRIALQEKEGKMGIPYLYDPNTNIGMFESGEIIAYLRRRYALDEAG